MKKVLFFFLGVIYVITCHSQSISVSSFKLLESDLTANTAGTMEQDQNGETAALIKVVTTQTGFTFDGGSLGIVKTKQTPGEVWVYVPRGSKKITIKHPQLGVLRDYYYPVAIEAARTYEMVLVSGTVQTIVQQARTSQYVVFQLNPSNAIVELDGSLLQTVDGTASKMMKFGSYDYRVQAPNYLPESGKVTVDDPNNKKVVNVTLKPNFSKVTVKVYNNAEIWINGEKRGKGTWTGDLGEGTYEFEAKLQGHRNTLLTKDVVITQEPQIINLLSPIPIYGEANINSSPAMADIYIDGEKSGQTPQLISKLLVGSHQLRLSKEGYEDHTASLTIKEGETTSLSAQLEKKKAIHSSSIKSVNNDSSIVNYTPAEIYNLKKQYKKNPNELVRIGKELLAQKKTIEAKDFAKLALSTSDNKYAPAYILLGDIEVLSNNGSVAAALYNQAIYADPKLVEAYYKYAMVYRKIDPKGAAQKLDELKANCPEVNVDAIKGHIFMVAGDEKNAYNEFKKVPIAQLDKSYLNEFARASYFQGHFEDALAACEQGLKDKPRNATFTRLAMFSNYELKNYEAAKGYIHKYFNETDSAKFSEYDHYYAALIYDALGEKQNAYDEYDKALALVQDGSMIKRWTILKTLSDAYLKDNNFEKAIKYYQEFTASKPGLTFDDEESLATIYSKYAKEDAAKKEELTNKAADIYAELAKKYPNQVAYATYMRANLRNSLDNNMEKSLAKPDYQKLVEILVAKGDRTKGENTMLKTAYHYLMFNSYINKDVAGAKAYAEKILAIDPEYKAAQEIMNLK